MYTGYAGAVIGALSQLGMGLYNNHFNAKEARAADSRSYKYSKKLATWNALHVPSLQRQGLEAAGYNPMLALGNIGGSSAGMAPAHSATSNLSFDGSSAKELGKFFEEMAKDKVKADVDNVKADTALKEGQLSAVESQRLQNEANTSLLMSQTERSDLAYGRDIVDTITGIAGTAGSLYSAKAMGDLAKSNTALNDKRLNQTKPPRDNMPSSRGKPSVQSTPNAKPNAGGLGHSAKITGGLMKSLAKEVAMDLLFLAPFAAAVNEYSTHEGRKRQGDHYRRNWESNKMFSPLR